VSKIRYHFIKKLISNPSAVLGLGLISLFLIVALLGPFIAPQDPYKINFEYKLAPPGTDGFLLGTDNYGRDILTRLIYGTRISLLISLSITAISSSIGLLVGVFSAYMGNLVDEVVMRVTEIFMAIPPFLFAMIIVVVLGPGLFNVVIALVLVWWPPYTRLARSKVLSVKQETFVEAGRALGMPTGRIVLKHIVPNSLSPILVQATMDVGGVILTATGLSFLGLGAQRPTPEWGLMVSLARSYLEIAWWYPIFPGLTIALFVFSFNIFGDAVRDIVDPRLTSF